MSALLSCTAISPLLGALLVLGLPGWHTLGLRCTALGSSCVSLLLTILLWISFDFALLRPQFTVFSGQPWVDVTLAVDGLSLLFMLLTSFTLPICLLLGWRTKQVKEYCFAFLILEFLMFAVFCSFDVFVFYGKRCRALGLVSPNFWGGCGWFCGEPPLSFLGSELICWA